MTLSFPSKDDMQENRRIAAHFQHVDTWVFDLDNTIYSADNDLWPQIDQRIMAYVCAMFGLDGLSARALQKYYYRAYGTTLRGLIAEYDVCPLTFLDFVHNVDRRSLQPDPFLCEAIRRLPGRKLIFTNGSKDHARQTLERLNLAHAFDDIFDIAEADYVPKPHVAVYEAFFPRHKINPFRAAMFEDMVRNLETPKMRGMTTIFVRAPQEAAERREDWENPSGLEHWIDFSTDDLAAFLKKICGG